MWDRAVPEVGRRDPFEAVPCTIASLNANGLEAPDVPARNWMYRPRDRPQEGAALDVPRPRPKRNRLPLYVAGGAILVVTSLGLARLRPAGPEVERGTLWIEAVKRGEMLVEVRGSGTLQPENMRLVAALTAGRVERVLVRAGARVEPTTVLLELANPDVQLEALDAERQLKLVQAELASLRTTLETQKLAQESAVLGARSEMREAKRALKAAGRLASEGLASSNEIDRARERAEETETRLSIEERRLALVSESLEAQLELRKAEVDRLQAISSFHRERVASQIVRAGAAGVVQELSLEPGQWVMPGQLLARVSGPERLKAVLRVPSSQARDLKTGLPASIDTRNGIVPGVVSRVDPGVSNGTVAVDVTLEGDLPKGARPDQTVDGVVELDRIPNAVYCGRPTSVVGGTTAMLFKLDRGGHSATRVPVRVGRASANAIEILEGLEPGDELILSDMSRYDDRDHLRIP